MWYQSSLITFSRKENKRTQQNFKLFLLTLGERLLKEDTRLENLFTFWATKGLQLCSDPLPSLGRFPLTPKPTQVRAGRSCRRASRVKSAVCRRFISCDATTPRREARGGRTTWQNAAVHVDTTDVRLGCRNVMRSVSEHA